MLPALDVPVQVIAGQLLIGLINGSFYAMLSLGLAIIFGLLNIVNFMHGAQYMLGAFVAWMLLQYCGIGYWSALLLAPVMVATLGALIEVVFLRRIYDLDHIYGLLLTFGLALVAEGVFKQIYGTSGAPYAVPDALQAGFDLGFMYLPAYRLWVVVVSLVLCLSTWLLIEKTRLGSRLRAATENPVLVEAFGINVPVILTLVYAAGVGIAALAGVMAAPIYQVSPLMGTNIIVVVFAVVVIGGMGSILGAIIAGFGVGLVEGIARVVYPEGSNVVIFLLMGVILLFRPSGLLGSEIVQHKGSVFDQFSNTRSNASLPIVVGLAAMVLAAPFLVYPAFLMKVLCFALFACAFNLAAGFIGLLSFGHAAFFGLAAYTTAFVVKHYGIGPELGLVAGASVAAVLGLVFGWLAIRRRGIYFSMVTLALAQLVYFYCLQASWTGGEDGIQAVPRGQLLGIFDLSNSRTMYYFVLTVVGAGIWLIYRIVRSPFGQILRAVRENEIRATSLGYEVGRYKLLGFVLSATLAGLAGSLKTLVVQLASLTDVHWTASGEVILMAMIGGLGTFVGPAVGAFVLVTLDNHFSYTGSWLTIIQGGVFIFCVLVFRAGIVGQLRIWRSRMPRRRSTEQSPLAPGAPSIAGPGMARVGKV